MSEHRPGCGEDVAPYALGALPLEDARAFEEHLSECALCRTDLETLRPVVHALARTPEQVEPPPELRRTVMAVVEREAAERARAERPASERHDRPAWSRWLPRPLPALAVACVLLVVGIGIGVGVTGNDAREFDGVAPAGVEAKLRLEDDGGKLVLHGMDSPPAGKVMQVWLVHGENGKPVPTDALFRPNRNGDASVAVPGDMDDVTRVMVSEEPEGGSPSPTSAPAIDFKLA